MAANAFALYQPLGEREGARWGASAAVIVALHVAAALLATSWLKSRPEQGVSLPAIMIEMSPSPRRRSRRWTTSHRGR